MVQPWKLFAHLQTLFALTHWGPRQNGCHFADDIFKCIFFNKNVWISIKTTQNFVPKGSIDNIPALIHIMAWCRPGDKSLSQPMMGSLLVHTCITGPQWVNQLMQGLVCSVMEIVWHFSHELSHYKQGCLMGDNVQKCCSAFQLLMSRYFSMWNENSEGWGWGLAFWTLKKSYYF